MASPWCAEYASRYRIRHCLSAVSGSRARSSKSRTSTSLYDADGDVTTVIHGAHAGTHACRCGTDRSVPALNISSTGGILCARRRLDVHHVAQVTRSRVAAWFSLSVTTPLPRMVRVPISFEPASLTWNGDWSMLSASKSYPSTLSASCLTRQVFSHAMINRSLKTCRGTFHFLLGRRNETEYSIFQRRSYPKVMFGASQGMARFT